MEIIMKKLKDPGSAITHFIGMVMAIFAATPLLIRAMREPDSVHVVSLAVFIISMILSATGCTSESESETGVILIYTEENVTFL